MKTTMLLTAALIGAATLSAHAGVRFGLSVAVPVAAPVVVAAPLPVTVPAYPALVATEVVPACPGPDYIWVPGYWTVNGYNRVWAPGAWQYRPARMFYGHDRDYRFDRDDHRR